MKTEIRRRLRTGTLLILTAALFAAVVTSTGCRSRGYGHHHYPAYPACGQFQLWEHHKS